MENQKYHHFKCSDFLLDDDFRAWQAGSTPEKDHLWEAWLIANPSAETEVNKARKLIYALHFKETSVGKQDIDLQWSKLESAIHNIDLNLEADEPVKKKYTFFFLCLLLLLRSSEMDKGFL